MRLESTVLSDLSANVFAALLLILLILLQAGTNAPAPDPASDAPARPIEATRDLDGHVLEPVRPDDLVRFFYDRRPEADGAAIDLTERGAALGRSGWNGTSASDLDDLLRRGDTAGRVRLYVFSNRHYAAMIDRLAKAGYPWREISVPLALRGPSGAWSPEFLALLDRKLDLGRFRAELGRLLSAAPGPLVPDGRIAGGGSGPAAAAPANPARTQPSLLQRLSHAIAVALAILAPLAGVIVVIAIEVVVPHAKVRYDEDTVEQLRND